MAASLGPPVCPIIDFHAHTGGEHAATIWLDAARTFGVERVHSMVRLPEADAIRRVLGDRVRFIAFPNFRASDPRRSFTEGFLHDIQEFHDRFDSRMIKLWNAPRLRDIAHPDDLASLAEFDGEWRVRHATLAQQLGMSIMVHVADPDTWFATRYSDPSKYGSKLNQYRGLRVMLDRFSVPWVAAHMGGWPEDLPFLSSLLRAHQNLYLDTSATKWIARELGRQPREQVVEFFTQWRGRLIFGSDIVSTDEHLAPKTAAQKAHPMGDLADGPEAAFELYASRYWTLRTMFESACEGESPIADPDLAMVDPANHSPMSAPGLRGLSLDASLLRTLYRDAALRVVPSLGAPLAG